MPLNIELHDNNINAIKSTNEDLYVWCEALQVLPSHLELMSDKDIEYRAKFLKQEKLIKGRNRGGAEIKELRNDQGLDDIGWGACQKYNDADDSDDQNAAALNYYPGGISRSSDYTRTALDDTVQEKETSIEVVDLPGGARLVTINRRVFIVGAEDAVYSSPSPCQNVQKPQVVQKNNNQQVCQRRPSPQQKMAYQGQPQDAGGVQQLRIVRPIQPQNELGRNQCQYRNANQARGTAAPQQQNAACPRVQAVSPPVQTVARINITTPSNQQFGMRFIDNRQAKSGPDGKRGVPPNQPQNACQYPVKPKKGPDYSAPRPKAKCPLVNQQQEMPRQCPAYGPAKGWGDPEIYETQRFGGLKGQRRVFEGEHDGGKIRGEVIVAGRPMDGGGYMKFNRRDFNFVRDD